MTGKGGKSDFNLSLCILSFIGFCGFSFAQITITNRGKNYWGGAYVAPQWTKTYKEYSIPSPRSSPYQTSSFKSVYSRPAPGPDFGNASTERKKPVGNEATLYMDRLREKYRNETARRQAGLYFEELDRAINLILREHDYESGLYSITHEMIRIRQGAENEIDDLNAREEFAQLTYEYLNKVEYYQYLACVKLGHFDYAISFYNLYYGTLGKHLPIQKDKLTQLLPLNAENYYFMQDTITVLPPAFMNEEKIGLGLQERFRAELYLVQLFLAQHKIADAQKAFQQILRFYSPRIDDMSYVANELALIYFAFGELDLAQMAMEYYCEYHQSNLARYRLLAELLAGQAWDGNPKPELVGFVERNMRFLEKLQSESSGKPAFYEDVWFSLYVEKINTPKAFVARAQEYRMANPADTFYQNANLDFYLTALLKAKDESGLKQMLALRKQYAEQVVASQKASNEQGLVKYIQTFAGLKRPDKSADYYEKRNYTSIWEGYYHRKAYSDEAAMQTFQNLDRFLAAGGLPYLKPFVSGYLDALKDYSQQEIENWRILERDFGLHLKKERKYPAVFNPTNLD